jgi:putative multiple sugar transport system substrate-binding protein
VVALLIVALAATACGSSTSSTSAGQTATTAAQGKVSFGVVLPTKDEPRWIQDQTRFQDAFKAAGYTVKVLFSQGNSAVERQNVESLISQGVKVIVLCPQDATAAAAAASEAKAAGIKVISTTV